jgi:hypothetical protein
LIYRRLVAAAESASRHNLKALDYPILPKSPSASKREFSELPNNTRRRNSHIFARARNDLYVEPRWCSERLFDVENFPEPVWDPCAGTDTIVESACAAGLRCFASDISTGRDFLSEPALTSPPFSVVTNPPYGLVREIVERALDLGATKIAILFPIAQVNAAWRWLEGKPVACLYLLTPRPSIPPLNAKKAGGGRVDFCWLVLDRHHKGPPTLGWLHGDNSKR